MKILKKTYEYLNFSNNGNNKIIRSNLEVFCKGNRKKMKFQRKIVFYVLIYTINCSLQTLPYYELHSADNILWDTQI